MNLDDREVKTKEEFISFLKELSNNYKKFPDEWENNKLNIFFDAMSKWVAEMNGYYKDNPQSEPADINWGFIANMFLAAKIYE